MVSFQKRRDKKVSEIHIVALLTKDRIVQITKIVRNKINNTNDRKMLVLINGLFHRTCLIVEKILIPLNRKLKLNSQTRVRRTGWKSEKGYLSVRS